jgi:hypothetical protein
MFASALNGIVKSAGPDVNIDGGPAVYRCTDTFRNKSAHEPRPGPRLSKEAKGKINEVVGKLVGDKDPGSDRFKEAGRGRGKVW